MITKNEFLEYLQANYIGWKLWTKEDIAAMLRKQGYSACASNISAVMRSGLDGLNDCTDHGLEIIESAITDAEWRGALSETERVPGRTERNHSRRP